MMWIMIGVTHWYTKSRDLAVLLWLLLTMMLNIFLCSHCQCHQQHHQTKTNSSEWTTTTTTTTTTRPQRSTTSLTAYCVTCHAVGTGRCGRRQTCGPAGLWPWAWAST